VSSRVLAATILSVATAFFYALSNVLEMLEAERVPEEYALRLGLMARLVKRPRWLAGLFSDVLGYGCQAAALGLAAVVFVEPILASGILIALFLAAAMTHHSIRRTEWIAAGALSAGLAVFLYEVSPTAGRTVGPMERWLVAGPIVVALVALSLSAGRAATGPRRGAAFGLAAGLAFGVSALLTKTTMHYFGDGVFAWVNHWEPYALAVSAIGGVVITQSALQTGALGAAVGATEATGPVSAAVLGLVVFDERFTGQGALQALAVGASVAAIIWGIATLAGAGERLTTETRPTQ
jgi:hypothetical protein